MTTREITERSKTQLKLLDLFSGIGGFSLGMERTGGFQTVAFCEQSPFCRAVLQKHWPTVPIYPDIKNLTYDGLKRNGISAVDIITGGFPCQDISHAGKQAGIIHGKRSSLWNEYLRLIGDIRPQFAVVENVPNLLTGDRGSWFGRLLGDLAEIGYDAEWHCISASQLGYYHKRNRIWIVAYPCGERRQNIFTQTQINKFLEAYKKGYALCAIPPIPRINEIYPDGISGDIRFHDGVSARVAQFKAFGNAIIPDIAELLGRLIMSTIDNAK